MDDLKQIVAQNIISLRTAAALTQYELGEKINYSDKAVSRWERGEAVPDARVLLQLAEIFEVSVDYILHDHSGEKAQIATRKHINHKNITRISIVSVWTIALFSYIVTFLLGNPVWLIFIYAVPVSLIVFLVLNSVWGNVNNNQHIISALVWSILATVYLTAVKYNWWIIFLLGVPAQIIIFLCFRIRKKSDK